ncbi:alpha-amylase family glycosyl hydrolase [Chitinispirillales bacterium ANBcel5]|uniref:alpha-amylase family glycosyl hydrolase n=1 Tax=Cellulosispirillum alkaliphilum TaxID=3039283 RepID=UPI002A4F48F1|nr:alpha-amylase family glycosyl hydrolase [Chitinispirillales bacterium ANBcel5]
MNSKKVPLIYNLFPRFFKTIDEWNELIPHVTEIGFNSIFVNPFHKTGFSGSLYAVKDYFSLNPLFLKDGQDPKDFTPLKCFIENCKDNGLEVIMDLVINHTAFDANLTESHPQWYKRDDQGKVVSPYAVDPADPSNVTVWGDLAVIDNRFSTDKNGLWGYWDKLIAFYQDLGFKGLRCDAAYQVPAELWKYLIQSAKKRDSETKFYAETLGCQVKEVEALGNVGFDYLFNSSKWWDFDGPWALEQHANFKRFAPSIAFPESHDTERLASIAPGTVEVQKFRYAFAALFSKGLLMPMGYEYGAKTKMDVVKGSPDDVDKPNWDLSGWIKRVNELKAKIPVLSEEGTWKNICDYRFPFIFLQKDSDSGQKSVFVGINKNMSGETRVDEWAVPEQIKQCTSVIQLLSKDLKKEQIPSAFLFEAADLVLFLQ